MKPYHKYPFKRVIAYKNQKVYNEHKKLKIMENLHFPPNNILTRLFKELKYIYK